MRSDLPKEPQSLLFLFSHLAPPQAAWDSTLSRKISEGGRLTHLQALESSQHFQEQEGLKAAVSTERILPEERSTIRKQEKKVDKLAE